MTVQPSASPSVHQQMLAAVPRLRAFAISLTGNVDSADDLVQEALTRGLSNLDRFQIGTNMQAWLFTILRNLFHSEYRKRRREVEDADGKYAAALSVQPDQLPHLDFDVGSCIEHARAINPDIEILKVSARSGEGMKGWIDWLIKASERRGREAEAVVPCHA